MTSLKLSSEERGKRELSNWSVELASGVGAEIDKWSRGRENMPWLHLCFSKGFGCRVRVKSLF